MSHNVVTVAIADLFTWLKFKLFFVIEPIFLDRKYTNLRNPGIASTTNALNGS